MLVNVHQFVEVGTHIKVGKLVVMSGVARKAFICCDDGIDLPSSSFQVSL